jgi:predicted transcriptional regulator
MSTTSLKLPDELKQLAIAAAKHRGITPHAFMVEAIRTVATAEKLRADFVADAVAARADSVRSGKGFRAADVHAYARARAQGRAAAKPKAKSWRS